MIKTNIDLEVVSKHHGVFVLLMMDYLPDGRQVTLVQRLFSEEVEERLWQDWI